MPYDPGWPSYSSNWMAGSVYWPVNEASSTIWPLPQLKLNDLGTSRDLGIVCLHTRGELMAANVTRAALPATAEEHEVVERMRRDGLAPYRWSNGPYDSYAAHSHAYHKVLYCARGSI